MSTADKLNKLLETKSAIKQAIVDKGVDVADDTKFADYPALIDSIPMEGGDPYYEEFYNMRTSNGTNMAGMFYYYNAPELDLRSLDVSKVTSMQYMFDHCSSSVNIDGWDTSNVTDMSYMFYYFSGSIDISKLDTNNITNANRMFNNANIDNIILTGLSFPKCTSLDYMFSNATGTTIDLSSWDISNITSMRNIFDSVKYKKIDLTGWNTSNVTNMTAMFNTYSNPLEELIIPDWDMTNVTSSSSFFGSSASYIQNLKLIDLSRSNDATIIKIASFLPTRTATTYGDVIAPYDTSQEAYDALVAKYWRPIGAAIGPVPTSCNIVAELDEIMPGNNAKVYIGACEPWNADPSKVELVLVSDSSIATMTEDNEVISTGVLGDIVIEARIIDTQEIIDTKTIPVTETDSYPNLIKFRVASTPASYNTVITVNGSSKKLSDLTYDSITDIYSYNAGAPITSIKFEMVSNINELIKLNASNMTSMSYTFAACHSLTELDLSNFDTSSVTNMSNMFYNSINLITLDLSNFDTSKVTNMTYMFGGCRSLHTLRLDNCSNDTINKIITSRDFPTNVIEGVTRTIYCKEENAAGLTPPTNWVFSYVVEEPEEANPREIIWRTTNTKLYNEDGGLYFSGLYLECNGSQVPEGNITVLETDDQGIMTCSYTSDSDITSVQFSNGYSLAEPGLVEVIQLDTSNVTNMSYMFSNCNNLIRIPDLDTSNVTEMNCMYYECSSMTGYADPDKYWNNPSVEWGGMCFYGCTNLDNYDEIPEFPWIID